MPGATPDATAPGPSEAQLALEQGQTAYRNGDYPTAEQWFDKAFQLEPSVTARYWRANSIDLQGRAADAVTAYADLFADPQLEQLPEGLRTSARQRYDLLSKIPATVLLNINPADAQVVVDGAPQNGTSPYVLKLPAGVHTLRVTREGYAPLEAQLDLKAAQSAEQTVQLNPETAPAAEAETAAPSEPRSRVPAYVTLGVAGVAAGLGTVFGIQALSAKDDFNAAPTAATADDVERNALISDMAWGIAITLGITGTVLLLSDEPTEQAPKVARKSLQLAPYVSPRGAGAAAQLTF